MDSEWVAVGFADSKIKVYSARTGVLSRTLVGHESGVWGLCLVSSGGEKLVSSNKSKGKKRRTQTRTRTSRDGKVEGLDDASSSQKQKRHRRSSNKDMDASSSQPSMRTLQAGVAGIDLNSNLDGSVGGMHVMPSESLESLVSPAMRIALGLEVSSTDSDHGDTGDDSHREDVPGLDSTERHARKGGTTSSEEEDLLDGVDQEIYSDKPTNLCFASQGWGQPNSLVVSGGCDKVVRVWDVQSG